MLTYGELQVLVLRQEGLSQAAIAQHLGITQGAVSRSLANARRKINAAKQDLALLDKLHLNPPEHENATTGLRQHTRRPR